MNFEWKIGGFKKLSFFKSFNFEKLLDSTQENWCKGDGFGCQGCTKKDHYTAKKAIKSIISLNILSTVQHINYVPKIWNCISFYTKNYLLGRKILNVGLLRCLDSNGVPRSGTHHTSSSRWFSVTRFDYNGD